MSAIITYLFDNPSNFVFDSDKIEFVGGAAKLKLIDDPGNDFQEDFADDTDFVYDPSKAEFVAGQVQQVDQRPANSIVAANFNSFLNANWGADGFIDLTANINGTPVLTGNKLDCTGTLQKGINYRDTLIGGLSGDWVAKFKYTPNYSGAPSQNVNLFALSPDSGTTDQVVIFHSPSGNSVRITANGLSAITFAAWNPTAGIEYTFEIICISNQVYVYIDGTMLDGPKTITPGQGTSCNRVWIGAYTGLYNVADGYFDDLILYSTAPQDENYTFPGTAYLQSSVVLPEMEYTGVGTLIEVTNFISTFAGAPRLTLEIGRSGNELYWNGSAWVTSNETYGQATDPATFSLNATNLPVLGEIYGQFKIYFTDSNIQGNFDNLVITLTSQTYSVDNPTLEIAQTFRIEELISFVETITESGLDAVKFIIKKDSVWYYWNGSAWTITDGVTYAQSSIGSDINDNASSFVDSGVDFGVKIFLHSNDGTTTPDISSLTITYDFIGLTQDDLFLCAVWFYARDVDGIVSSDDIFRAAISSQNIRYKNNVHNPPNVKEFSADLNGYVEMNLLENINMVDRDNGDPVTYKIYRNYREIAEISVPEQSGALLWDITI